MTDAISVSLPALLKKTEHYDKDERYMATSDLCELLKRQQQQSGHGGTGGGPDAGPAVLDAATERQICTAVLRLLHDKSHDVQAVAVKTLGVLLGTVQAEQVLEIADSLADQVLADNKGELRDVYAIGLRTLVKTVPAAVGGGVSERLAGRLVEKGTRRPQAPEEIVLACLDVLTDLLQRFGATAAPLARQHEPILQTCLAQIATSPHPVVRKRAGTALACLSAVLSDALLMRLVESLLGQIDRAEGVGRVGRRKTRSAHAVAGGGAAAAAEGSATDTRALIRTMCAVAGQVGHRLGQEQIDRIVPIFLRFTDPEDAVSGDDDEDEDMQDDNDRMDGEAQGEAATTLANELRESCFMGFESFVRSCPKEVEPHLEKIIPAVLAYLQFDPNYCYGSDDIEVDEQDADDDYDAEDDDYEEDDDDEEDDESWKVRRGAIRALKAMVQSKKHDPSMLWKTRYSVRSGKSTTVAEALVLRFKEREENCRVEVIDCFTLLLDETIKAAQVGIVGFSCPDEMDTSTFSVAIDLRHEYAPKIVKACEKVLAVKKGNERSKSCALGLLATLCQAPEGIGGEAEIASVLRHTQSLLSGPADGAFHREGTSKALRLDALSLVRSMLTSPSIDPVHVRTSLRRGLLQELCSAANEQWYKVIAEALRAISAIPRYFVIGYANDTDISMKKKEGEEVANALFNAIEPLLAAHDVDQEIKECALLACGTLLSSLHERLDQPKQDRLLRLLLERLRNETTRIAAIRTIAEIAAASQDDVMIESRLDLSPILSESISVMASFMKYQSRSLKQAALEALNIIVVNHGSHPNLLNGELFSSLLQELASLIVDSDLHLSHLSLRVAVSVLQACPEAGAAAKAHCLEPALALSKSGLLQDHALESLLDFFKGAVVSQSVGFDELLFLLRQRLDEKTSKQGICNLAKCIAVIAAVTTAANREALINEVIGWLENGNSPVEMHPVRQIQLCLLITGDLGRLVDLDEISGAAEKLKIIYVNYFDSSSEELKSAAAYSLGNASVGSQRTFLPTIVSKLDEGNKKQQYLLLSALREFIQSSSRGADGTKLAASLAVIIPPLEKHTEAEEEGVRTMVAECLGCLTCVEPGTMLPKLVEIQRGHERIIATNGTVSDDDMVSKKNAHVCWTVATCVKVAIVGKVDATHLAISMPTFVHLIKQTELSVRHAALLMIYAAAKSMPSTIAPLLHDGILPVLYEISDLKLERKVDLGPFTHKVDDALPLRKATLSVFATCLESLPQNMEVSAFIPILVKSLADAEDIQLHAHQIVLSMIAHHPTYIIASVESLVEPLEKTLNKKPGQKTGTELERMNDWIKSTLRVVLALKHLDITSRVFLDFVSRVQGNTKFQSMLESLQEEQR